MASTIDTRAAVKGNRSRRVGGLTAAALGLTLLAGVLGQARLGSQAAAPTNQRTDPYWAYEEDVVLNGNPAAVAFPGPAFESATIAGETPCPLGGTAPCGLAASPDAPTVPDDVTDSATLRFHEDNAVPAADFAPDQFTYREDRRAEGIPSCIYASAAGAPGEGCVPGPRTTDPVAATGTDDFAMNWCSETAGPFACAAPPRDTANQGWAIYDGTRAGLLEMESGAAGFVPDRFSYRDDHRGEMRDGGVVDS